MQYFLYLDIFGPNALELKSKLEKLHLAQKDPPKVPNQVLSLNKFHRDLLCAPTVISPGVESVQVLKVFFAGVM